MTFSSRSNGLLQGRRITPLLALALLFAASACDPAQVVYIPSPYERYDHNRSRPVVFKALSETRGRLLDNSIYIPYPGERFPAGAFDPETPPPDGVATARLVPVFPGVALPLSANPVSGGASDREDLLDFLAAGPLAGAGVKRPPVRGELPEVVMERYKPIIELLSSNEVLGGGRKSVIDWAERRGMTWTGKIFESRYHPASIAQLIALRLDSFWFVLFGFPESRGFTRLVVVPIRPDVQDFDKKAPAETPGGSAN